MVVDGHLEMKGELIKVLGMGELQSQHTLIGHGKLLYESTKPEPAVLWRFRSADPRGNLVTNWDSRSKTR